MYELIQVSNNSYYIDCPAKMGLIRINENKAVLIDSGSDKDAGKKALRILQNNGWDLIAIYNTHSHADHIGGNKYLQSQTNCCIFASGIECDFTNHPILEPSILYGGYPLKELKHKFLMAQESYAKPLTEQVLENGISIIDLPGHSFDMVGFRTADDVVYIADCVSSEQTLEKYGIGYLWNVEAHLNTLEKIKNIKAKCFVPAHAPVTDDIVPLAQLNINAVKSVCEKVILLCKSPVTFDELLQTLFTEYNLKMTLQQHALIGSTLRSYLSYLESTGKISIILENNKMLFKQI